MSEAQFEKLIRSKAKQHTGDSFKYFWASFLLQIFVYAATAHLFIIHFGNWLVMAPAFVAAAAYIPFTVVLMRKFKALAILKDVSIKSYINKQYELLSGFYTFKKRYELMLIPLACAVGTFLTFELTVPGGVWTFPSAAVVAYIMALGGCVVAVKMENERSFDSPLTKLRMILSDLNAD